MAYAFAPDFDSQNGIIFDIIKLHKNPVFVTGVEDGLARFGHKPSFLCSDCQNFSGGETQ